MIGRLLCFLGLHKDAPTSADWLGTQLVRTRYVCARCKRVRFK